MINKKRLAAWLAIVSIGAGIGYYAGQATAAEPSMVAREVPQTQFTSLGEFEVSAYCPCEKCCGKYADGLTAIGTTATEGRTVAVDPSVIPYGTHIWLNGHEYIAEDCGGAIKGNKIDMYYADHQTALEHGITTLEVWTHNDANVY